MKRTQQGRTARTFLFDGEIKSKKKKREEKNLH